jgi:DNA polymerase-3 subunit gamma/tau
MAEYKVLARRYRPQSFREVIGQEAIVTTLKNAIKQQRLAHAYLFSGSRGTGKTTLARVFAKALNCLSPQEDGEPCNRCSACKEISTGSSMDILEIDGASHRGIDDVRQINETVGYASSSGKYKIYIIDEVHMLTKEAFNALLKTLEEPPPKVLFLFATTEPHKVLPTILSRCQRFNLNRIPVDKIAGKLQQIAAELHVEADPHALRLLAQRADGGLRDAESLFDQLLAFHEGPITTEIVADVLGMMPKESFFLLDRAGKEGRLTAAFEIAQTLFSQGKDLLHFVENLSQHFRTLLLFKLAGPESPLLQLSETDKGLYAASAALYSQEQCLALIDYLVEAQNRVRFHSSSKIVLESLLLHVLRIHQRVPIEVLVRRLAELEQAVHAAPLIPSNEIMKTAAPSLPPAPLPLQATLPVAVPVAPPPVVTAASVSVAEDPEPTPRDLGKKEPLPAPTAPSVSKQHRYDTLLQFAAVELEATIKTTTNRT